MFKKLLIITTFLTVFLLISNSYVSAQVISEDAIKDEISEFFDAGAKGYLIWQYSGTLGLGGEFGSDQYSFFRNSAEGSAICNASKELKASYPDKFLGVNMWDAGATRYSQAVVEDNFNWLKSCGMDTVRVFASADGAPGINKVLQAGNNMGMKIIVAIGDYSNGGGGIPQGTSSNPLNWYKEGYKNPGANNVPSYLELAQEIAKLQNNGSLFGIELANEAHCSGITAALPHYIEWGKTIGNLFYVNVGYGQKSSEDTTRCDSPSPGDFIQTNSINQITMTSAHYYNLAEKTLSLKALSQHQNAFGSNKFFYIGEAPFVLNELDGLSCEEPLVLNADTSCATCSVQGVVTNASSWFQNAIAFVTQIFPTTVKRLIVLNDYKGVIPPIDTFASRQKGSKGESPLAYFTTHLDQNLEEPTGGPPQTGGANELDLPPKIANIDKLAPPGKSTKDLQAEYLKCLDTPTEVEVIVSGAEKAIKHADIRVYCAQKIASTFANNLWSTPENQLSWTPPVGYTMEEAFGAEKTKDYKQYLALAQRNYLAKNYSNEQKQQIALNTVKQRQIDNNVKYNPIYKESLSSAQDKIQTAAVQDLSIPACVLPVRTNVKTTCSELLGKESRGVKIEREVGNTECTSNGDGTGSCGTNSVNVDVNVVVEGYGGCDITPGIAVPGGVKTCDAFAFLNQNSGGNTANSGKIQLTSTNSGYSGGYNNPGFTVASTLGLAFLPPEKAENQTTIMSEEVPFSIVAKNTGLFSGHGDVRSNSNLVHSTAAYTKKCSLPTLTSLSLIPDSEEAKILESYLEQCEGSPNVASQDYCGTVKDTLNNSSKNFTITRPGMVMDPTDPAENNQSLDPNNPYNFLDKDSDLQFSISNNYVDGATLILNHEILAMNPGQTQSKRCGGTGDDPNPTYVEIYYLPRTAPFDVNIESNWNTYASKLSYNPLSGGKFTNAVFNFRVKEGYYKIKVLHHPCLHDAKYLGRTSGVIKLFKEDAQKKFCAKIINNSNMPGGGYADPITGDILNNNIKETMGCTLSNPYNVYANNQCGGLHGSNGESDFWKDVASLNIVNSVLGSISYNDGLVYSKRWLYEGLQMYEKMFGLKFNADAGGCKYIFPTTVRELTGDECSDLSNGVSLVPAYEAETPLPTSGIATYYGEGVMDEAIINQRNNYGEDKIPADLSMTNKGKYVGFVALLRQGDIGREVWITNPDTGDREGPFLVVDVAARKDISNLLSRNWVVDVDYETGKRWKMSGPKDVTVYDRP